MPGRDGTGPMGQGRLTGRGLGPCGRGLGRGVGLRRGLRRFWRGYPYDRYQETDEEEMLEDELRFIEGEKQALEEDMERVKRRLDKLKNNPAGE